jgi:hypothetical protein
MVFQIQLVSCATTEFINYMLNEFKRGSCKIKKVRHKYYESSNKKLLFSYDCGQFFISNFVSGIYEEYCCLTFSFQSAKKLVRHGFPKEDIFYI